MFDNLRGIITFEAVVSDTESFVNNLKSSFVSVTDLHCSDGKIVGNVYKKNFGEIEKIALKCNAEVSIINKKGGIFTVQKYRRRTGIIAGMLAAFFMIVYLSNTVMVIEIYGNETVTDKQILSLLNDSGIHIGTFIPNINLREAERNIVYSSDEIAWIGIRSSGSIVQAEIREMDNPPEMIPTSVPCNIISSKDAQIVAVKNVHMGMLVTMLYEGVQKGDLLISGTFEDGKGGVYYTHSMGEIIGRYSEKVVFQQPYTDTQINYTEKLIRKKIRFFCLDIPLYSDKSVSGQYEYDENITYLKLFNMQLPIGIIYSEYNQYESETISYTPEEAKAMLEDKIKLYEHNFFDGEDIVVVDKEVMFTENNDKMTAVIKYTLEGNIGITQEIMAK